MMAMLSLVLVGCDAGSDPDASPLDDLDLIGVDFELNSMIISNTGDEEVRTQGLWAYRDGESFEFNIFIIEPRASILFNMSELGEISTGGGEVALADSDSFTDPDSMLEYVAWGDGEPRLRQVATDAGLWPEEGTADVTEDAIVLIRTDPTNTGPDAWQSSNEIP